MAFYRSFRFIVALILIVSMIQCEQQIRSRPETGYSEWQVYGGDSEFTHYSTLTQINRENVHNLQVAWTHETGDAFPGSEMEANPIIIDGIIYTTTPKLRVIALDGSTGELVWDFNPFADGDVDRKMRNRGVTYWKGESGGRIFVSARHFLYALDARSGDPIPQFGENGRVDLRQGLGREPESLNVGATSPGIVYEDLLIMGSIVSEGLPSAPGHIRAYDCRTGELRWTFRTIPRPGEPGYETWPQQAYQYIGGANNWAGMSLDQERGLVYAPTGSAAFDFYGANRHGDNLYANSLLAMDASTGERIWHFQAVRHDVWDRDFPAAPTLVTVKRRGKLVDAVAQITKSGHVYAFNRATGEPLFPIEDVNVPESDVPGEQLAGKQPLPVKPAPFARQEFTPELVTERTKTAHDSVFAKLKMVRNGKQFTPPSTQGTVIFPGFDGGGEWGGAAFDPETGVLYINSNEMAWILRLVKKTRPTQEITSRELYLNECASCHRPDMEGTPPEFPSLIEVGKRRSLNDIKSIIRYGSGRMVGFSSLSEPTIKAIAEYVMTGRDTAIELQEEPDSPVDLDYTHDGYNKFLDPEGYPAVEPPWGTLNALDLDTGEYLWQIPLGNYPDLDYPGLEITGCENYGGPVVTAGGLLFIGATIYDKKFRVFDKKSGELLWETTLPAAGTATPATYMADGKQFVVIAAGGGKWGAPSGGKYVAFMLPE